MTVGDFDSQSMLRDRQVISTRCSEGFWSNIRFMKRNELILTYIKPHSRMDYETSVTFPCNTIFVACEKLV